MKKRPKWFTHFVMQRNTLLSVSQVPYQQQMSVDEALYILGKNFLGRNVTDRLFPLAKQVVTGFNQVTFHTPFLNLSIIVFGNWWGCELLKYLATFQKRFVFKLK